MRTILTVVLSLWVTLAAAGVADQLDNLKSVCDQTKIRSGNTGIASIMESTMRKSNDGTMDNIYVTQGGDTLSILLEASNFVLLSKEQVIEVGKTLIGLQTSMENDLDSINTVVVFMRTTGEGIPRYVVKKGEGIFVH